MLQRMLPGFLIALGLPIASQAAYWSPHVGADFVFMQAEPAPVYEDIFPRIKAGGYVYAGTRINGLFGLDIGYEQSEVHHRNHIFEGGELVFVDPINAAFFTPESLNNQSEVHLRTHSFNIDLNFYWEVVHRFELMFMMGAAFVNPKTHIFHYDVSDERWVEYENHSEMFWSGRFGFGAQYNPIPCLGIKGLLYWDQIKRLNYYGEDIDNNQYNFNPYHRATSFNLGVVYSFSNPRRHKPKPPEEDTFY